MPSFSGELPLLRRFLSELGRRHPTAAPEMRSADFPEHARDTVRLPPTRKPLEHRSRQPARLRVAAGRRNQQAAKKCSIRATGRIPAPSRVRFSGNLLKAPLAVCLGAEIPSAGSAWGPRDFIIPIWHPNPASNSLKKLARPRGVRTPNPQIRSLVLYPVELRAHNELALFPPTVSVAIRSAGLPMRGGYLASAAPDCNDYAMFFDDPPRERGRVGWISGVRLLRGVEQNGLLLRVQDFAGLFGDRGAFEEARVLRAPQLDGIGEGEVAEIV